MANQTANQDNGEHSKRGKMSLQQPLCTSLLAAFVFTVVGLATGQTDVKRAHEWTLEERLTARFDSAAVEHRRVAAMGKSYHGEPSNLVDSIDGRVQPELFMPWELFDRILLTFASRDPEIRSSYRQLYEGPALELGFDAEAWRLLQSISEEYWHSRRQLRLRAQLARVTDPQARPVLQKMNEMEIATCRLRAEALAEARRVFGPVQFDSLLYEAVAPLTSIIVIVENTTPKQMRFIARGCQ